MKTATVNKSNVLETMVEGHITFQKWNGKKYIDMKEVELRDHWMEQAREVKTPKQFMAFFNKLTKYKHDYGTICRAIAAVGVAGCWLMERSGQGGITGFQAGCIKWDLLCGWMREYKDKPLKLLDYSELLYPQKLYHFNHAISKETAKWLKAEAKKNLKEVAFAHKDVIAHWKKLASGWLPKFVKIKEN